MNYTGYYLSIDGEMKKKDIFATSSREAYSILQELADVQLIYNVTIKH